MEVLLQTPNKQTYRHTIKHQNKNWPWYNKNIKCHQYVATLTLGGLFC